MPSRNQRVRCDVSVWYSETSEIAPALFRLQIRHHSAENIPEHRSQAKPCKECGETGTISCKLCLGDGKRLDSRDYDGLKRMEEANVRLGIVDDESNQDP